MSQPLFKHDLATFQRPDGLTVISRASFPHEYFDYKHGEHVVFGGPTTRGKTTLAFDLMEAIVTEKFPAYLAQSKPRDPVTETRGRQMGFRFVSEWPPPPKLMEMLGGEKPKGFVVAPHFGDLNTDMVRCAEITYALLMERYAAGAHRKNKGGILVMDDTMVKAKIMGLDDSMVTILAMAGAMDLGLWTFVQKPTDSGRTTLWAYEQSTHLFFTKGGDRRMLQRYAEIIGDQGDIAKRVIPTLKDFEFLYVHKTQGFMCIVGAKP